MASLRVYGGRFGRTVPEDQQPVILEWCREHGLLGILMHRLETIVLPERMATSEIFKELREPTTIRFIRTASGWMRDGWMRFGRQRPRVGAYMRSLHGYETKLEPISAYGAFLPDIAASKRWSRLPPPATDRFWQLYAEPLDHFLDAAEHLRRVVGQTGDRTKPEEAQRGIYGLRILTAPVRTVLYRDDQQQLAVGWACHSLLASYAMMATLDLAQTRLLRCNRPECGAYFISKSQKAQYCSPACRSIVQMRRSRLKRKHEEPRKVR